MTSARHGIALAAIFLAGACVNVTSRERARIDALAAEDVPQHRFCVELPTGDPRQQGAYGEMARISAEFVDLPGARGRDGIIRYAHMEALRQTYDLLVEFGLYTVAEEPTGEGSDRIWRRYRQTPLGAAHLRDVPRHGQSSLALLCYGKQRLVEIRWIGPVYRHSRCAQGRGVRYAYVYEDLPAWVEDPRLRESFPNLVTRQNAAEVREDSFALTGSWREWYVDYSGLGPNYPVCG
jgi:hypothetical protein